MSPWSKRVLVATMVIWSALTLGAGWYALRGNSGSAQAARGAPSANGSTTGKTISAAAATTTASSSKANGSGGAPNATGTPGTSSATALQYGNSSKGTATAPEPNGSAPRLPLSLQPVPANVASAGVDPRAESLDPDGPGPAPPRPPSKGVIVLDPGHGRGDPGAVHHDASGNVDITEADSNLRNAELMRDDLVALGYEVYLTRNGEGQGPGAPLPLQFITSDLYARVALAKAVNADLYLAIHGNGASVPFLSGPETWYCGKHEEGAANEKLASMVQQAMMDALHEYGYFPPDRGIKEDAETHHSGDFCQFVVTRESPVPAALLEFLFLTNDDDAKVLLDDQSHVLMAKHVAAAIDQFMQERTANP
jgi:N-acetylmuramoyl-L-alanine amidase